MRLIDADALPRHGQRGGLVHWKDIEDAPTIDRLQGEWIRDRYWSRGVGMGEEYGFFYKCSLCEYEVESGYTRCCFNFCPYCGADMREIAGER